MRKTKAGRASYARYGSEWVNRHETGAPERGTKLSLLARILMNRRRWRQAHKC